MIKCHPGVSESSFDRNIEGAIHSAELTGYISRKTLKDFYNLFSWIYMQGNTNGAFDKNTKLEKFLDRFDLFRFKGESICYSAVLFYQKLSKAIDLRALEDDSLTTASPGSNKLFFSDDFSFKALYELYSENSGDLSTDFLLFNDLFKTSVEKEVKKLRSFNEITRVTEITSLVRPDLRYKIATHQLDVNRNREITEKTSGKIFILQDCTHSMKQYESQLKMIKAFILETAFRNDYEVEWLFISDRENHRVTYNKSNISSVDIQFVFSGAHVDTSMILIQDEFIGKQIVIITDGTDTFNFPFNTKTKNINVISFLDNINIKDKISSYGKFFRVFT